MSKFRLSALASVCFFLASCGGGSGDNSISTNYEPEPRPPGPDRLTATGGGDGENQEEEKRKIVVNIQQEEEENEEENDIIVEQPEEKSESEEEENNNNEEETPQQLTIIEEEDFPYVPPEEEEPRYLAATQNPTQGSGNSLARTLIPEPKAIENCGDITGTGQAINCAPAVEQSGSILGTGHNADYEVHNNWYSSSFVNLQGKDRDLKANLIGRTNNAAFRFSEPNYNFAYKNIDPLKYVKVTYEKEDGFFGVYSYKGDSGEITEDVKLTARFNNPSTKALLIEGYIGDSGGITIEGTHFGQIRFSANRADNGQFLDSNQVHFSNLGIRAEKGFNEVRGSFKNDGSSTSFPSQVVGELKMKRFFDTSPNRNQNVYEYNDNLFKRGDNALAGVFVADKTNNEQVKYFVPLEEHLEGSIGMFSYGIWASQNWIDNRIVFLEQTTKFNPSRAASDYTSHTTPNEAVFYKRENGFKGAYIYEGETGELTGDVELGLNFSANAIYLVGSISTDLEIEGHDLEGIGVTSTIDSTTGVGGSLEPSSLLGNPYVRFGDYNISDFSFSGATVNHQGQAKLRMALSSDGIQAQGSTPETYPSQIAGEVEINGFKIYSDDGDNNTVVGVFVADKQE